MKFPSRHNTETEEKKNYFRLMFNKMAKHFQDIVVIRKYDLFVKVTHVLKHIFLLCKNKKQTNTSLVLRQSFSFFLFSIAYTMYKGESPRDCPVVFLSGAVILLVLEANMDYVID